MEVGKTPKEIRQAIRQGRYTGGTAGLAPGYVQANLVVLPRAQAYDFLVFCQRNPRPCPLIEVTDAGNPEPAGVAAGADLRTDISKYRIYRDGRLDAEVTDITNEWRDDFVAFLLGPPLLGYVAEHFGIRWSFGIGIPLVILSLIFAGALGRRPVPHEVLA